MKSVNFIVLMGGQCSVVKGISRRVIVVDSPDPRIFEQAIFILRGESGGVSQQQLVDQAVRIAKSYSRTHGLPKRRTFPSWVWAAGGGAVIGLLWLLVALF